MSSALPPCCRERVSLSGTAEAADSSCTLVSCRASPDDERCAKDWMTGKGQLRGGGENAHASIAAVLGREQEDGLGQIHLPGQALHLVVAERRPVFEHRQLVPLQWRVSKHIDDYVGQ